jgi:hypothetical protein
VLPLAADWRLSCLSLMPLPLRQADRPLIREPVEGDAGNSATDTDWFLYLRERNAEEMNFWRARATTKFKILEQNELFLFKSKYLKNMIVGGAFLLDIQPSRLILHGKHLERRTAC